ncbi:MAG: rhomboid family intramembrane serine protease [Deltaproteobacteria bacterium]|nr:rhomboid family intramembrane serine protease [Deltaproteobacteria bacterium]
MSRFAESAPQSPIASMRPTLWVKRLLIAHAVSYVVFLILASWVKWPGAIDLALIPSKVESGYVWQLATYIVTGNPLDPGSFLFDLLALFFFGPEMERTFGPRRFLGFYALVAVVTAVLVVTTGFVSLSVARFPYFGFAAPVVGLIVAFGVHYPTRQVLLVLWPVKAWTLVLITLGIIALYGLSRGPESVLLPAYGAFVAWLLTTGYWNPRRAWTRFRTWRLKRELRVVRGRDDKYWN